MSTQGPRPQPQRIWSIDPGHEVRYYRTPETLAVAAQNFDLTDTDVVITEYALPGSDLPVRDIHTLIADYLATRETPADRSTWEAYDKQTTDELAAIIADTGLSAPTPGPRPIDTADIGLSILALTQLTGPPSPENLALLLGERTAPNLQNHLVVSIGMVKQLLGNASKASGVTPEEYVDKFRRTLLELQATGGQS